jgi:hypothetical protein
VLLGAGADPLALARYSNTGGEYQPIHAAARWSARLVHRLVQAGASIDGDVAGHSTLRAAAGARTALGVRMIPALVALGARETGGNEAMRILAFYPVEGAPPSDGEVAAALTALVTVGCSLTQPNALGMAPMDNAALTGNAPVVRALLSLGVAATTKSLVCAVTYPGVARLLVAAGAPMGELGRVVAGGTTVTPLMQASLESSLESVQLLLAAGADVNVFNERGHTALMASLWSKHTDATAIPRVVDVLLAAGADIAAHDVESGTALHHLAVDSHGQPWAAAVARLLLGAGADGRAVNAAGKTPAQCVPISARGGELHQLLLVEAAEA